MVDSVDINAAKGSFTQDPVCHGDAWCHTLPRHNAPDLM